jgi:hypothetical protein
MSTEGKSISVNEVGQYKRTTSKLDKPHYFCNVFCKYKYTRRENVAARLGIISDMKSIIQDGEDLENEEPNEFTEKAKAILQLAEVILKFTTKKINKEQFSEQASDLLQILQDITDDDTEYLIYVKKIQYVLELMRLA